MRVAINSYISKRGISGSAIGVGKIHDSLVRLGHEVIVIEPSRKFELKFMNLLYLVMWDSLICSRIAVKAEAKILFNTCNTGLKNRKIKSVLVMHDTMVLDYKNDFNTGYRYYAKIMFWLSAKTAKIIMTPSEFSKKSILKHWPSKNVKVNYWPIKENKVYQPRIRSGKFTILWNAAMERHKQPNLMLDIAVETKSQLGNELQLVIVTRRGNAWSSFIEQLDRIPNWNEWIKIYSDLSSDELSSLYENSDILLVTSKAEGFCLPALEAMSKSVPVVHNNIPTLVEVCGYRIDDQNLAVFESMVKYCLMLFKDFRKYEELRIQVRKRSLDFSEERFDVMMQSILMESQV